MALARLTDPETSHEAAASVKNITKTQTVILDLLSKPMTDEKLISSYKLRSRLGVAPKASESGIRSRRAELVRAGKVIDTGSRTKLTSGRQAIVWAAK